MIQTLIFDFDGTLVDSMALYVNGFNQVAQDFNLPTIKKSDIDLLKQISAREIISQYKINPIKLAKILYTVNQVIGHQMADLEFFPQVKAMLVQLAKNYKLGILTSNYQKNVEAFLNKQSLHVFDYIYCSKSLFGKDKTFNSLIKKYQLNKEDILYFGDEVRDIEACRKIGVKVAAVTWGFNQKTLLMSQNPDFLFSSPEEILHHLV
jgi:HAD superfamily hydrolase (TIGR01549 family)